MVGYYEKPIYQKKVIIKNTLFSKPKEFNILFYKDYIDVNCYIASKDGDDINYRFTHVKAEYSEIASVQTEILNKYNYLQFTLTHNKNSGVFYLFPITDNNNDMTTVLCDNIENFRNRQNAKNELDNELRRKAEELKRQKELELEENLLFYKNTYDFHIKSDTPHYTFESSDDSCSLLYISNNKSLNFLAIDGKSRQEVNGIIPYDHIHYYEKAGTIHYVTAVNASYTEGSSFGGSFKPGRCSIASSMLGGLLFGPMGMAIGAMAGYKPAEYTPPTYTPGHMEVQSNQVRIDERSVILNYYSDEHKQYMDIELPQDIFNFLQTHYAEKKYDIVIELEKQNAASANKQISSNNSSTELFENTTDKKTYIKQRLADLKELFEDGLINETDYETRKKEILSEI